MAQTNDLMERIRQIRIEQGLSPEPPDNPKFVSIPLSLALVDRMEPFKAITAKYASILAQGHITRIDTDKLAEYERAAKLLSYSRGTFSKIIGMGVTGAISLMKSVNDAIDNSETADIDINDKLRRIHYCIGFMTKHSSLYHDAYDYDDDVSAAMKEKKRLLSDPVALQAEIDAALKRGINNG